MFGFILSPYWALLPKLDSPGELGLASLLLTTVVGPLVQGYLTRKQLRLAAQLQAETHKKIDTMQESVQQVETKADAAFHAANNVNEWRGELQQQLLNRTDELKAGQKVISKQVEKHLKPPPPLVILPPPPAEDEDCAE